MRDAEIMVMLDTLVVAERRKSGIAEKEEESMSGDALEGVRWTTPSENDENDDEDDEDDKEKMDDEDDDDEADETTMDLVALE
jgi:hypothetical protein